MKRKILSAVIYVTSAFALAEFFDGLYGAAPVPLHLGLVHLAIAGTILFAAACLFSLFTLRVGVICGLGGGLLSWPYFAIQLPIIPLIPWGSLVSSLFHANLLDLLLAMLVLVVSSVYSVNQLRILLRGRSGSEAGKMKFKLFAALLYAAGIFCLANWYGIWHWFLLRHHS